VNSTQLLETVARLSSDLGETQSDCDELKSQLRSFSGELLPDEEMPVALPESFDPAKARAELDAKLLSVHKLRGQLSEAEASYKTARQEEIETAFSELKKKYRQTIVALLKSAVSFARSLEDAEQVRDESLRVTGQNRLPHIGPTFSHFSLHDHSSFMSHWIREARDHGFVSSREDWLKDIVF
jgi:hypothetical protein